MVVYCFPCEGWKSKCTKEIIFLIKKRFVEKAKYITIINNLPVKNRI